MNTLRWRAGAMLLTTAALLSACGGGGAASAAPTAAPTAATTSAPTPSASPTPNATPAPSGAATVSGPAQIAAGTGFDVTWTGPNADRDYVTIVKVGTTKWTDEQYFYTANGPTGKLVAPIEAGAYELWYVTGADDTTKARSALTVTPFVGTLDAPADVQAGSKFNASWTGPNGPKDYVTIIAVGKAAWTNESYFYTNAGPTGSIVAPIKPGAYEVWYVTGLDPAPQVRRPITVTPFAITLEAPDRVKAKTDFQIKWTGPDGPSDYITIVPAGSADGTYTVYAYTASGSPITLTAPSGTGNYELWYASDREKGVFARRPIVVE